MARPFGARRQESNALPASERRIYRSPRFRLRPHTTPAPPARRERPSNTQNSASTPPRAGGIAWLRLNAGLCCAPNDRRAHPCTNPFRCITAVQTVCGWSSLGDLLYRPRRSPPPTDCCIRLGLLAGRIRRRSSRKQLRRLQASLLRQRVLIAPIRLPSSLVELFDCPSLPDAPMQMSSVLSESSRKGTRLDARCRCRPRRLAIHEIFAHAMHHRQPGFVQVVVSRKWAEARISGPLRERPSGCRSAHSPS